MIKKFFPGANSALGFYSLYDWISPHPLLKIILKGGPGVGKSTFIKRISQRMLEEGWKVEYHCCSSDESSLDGTLIDGRVAIIDGTAPHTVDPIHPGVMDEILNLGEFWDERPLREKREEIILLGERISDHFKRAYLYLEEVGLLHHRLNMCFQGSWSKEREILNTLKQTLSVEYSKQPLIRHLFASAITPKGVINHIKTLLEEVETIYLLKLHVPGREDRILKSLAQEAIHRGLDTLILHCGLHPEKYHHLIIEEIKLAILTESSFLASPDFHQRGKEIIPLSLPLTRSVSKEDLFKTKEAFHRVLGRATEEIGEAKDLHHKREAFYIESMDFEKVDRCSEKTLERIKTSLRAL